MNSNSACVYILANKRIGTLYIGVTSELKKRIYQHKYKLRSGFTSEYGIDKLVYFECGINIQSAIRREKQLKKWNRKWKIDLIEKFNPEWNDKFNEL